MGDDRIAKEIIDAGATGMKQSVAREATGADIGTVALLVERKKQKSGEDELLKPSLYLLRGTQKEIQAQKKFLQERDFDFEGGKTAPGLRSIFHFNQAIGFLWKHRDLVPGFWYYKEELISQDLCSLEEITQACQKDSKSCVYAVCRFFKELFHRS